MKNVERTTKKISEKMLKYSRKDMVYFTFIYSKNEINKAYAS